MPIKKILKTLLKIAIEILKFPFKMTISTYYIKMCKIDEAEDIIDE